jgi:hypothetical protein
VTNEEISDGYVQIPLALAKFGTEMSVDYVVNNAEREPTFKASRVLSSNTRV